MVSAVQPKGQYRPDIDGLRALAVMAVVLHHLSAKWVPGGFIGVDVFFVISGYLITKIISREIADGTFTFVRFYERRIRRLFPALLTVLAFVLVAGWFVLLPSDYLATLRASAATLLFSANILFWHVQADYFAADAKLNPLLHMWSLGVEEQFYLLFPIVLVMIHRWMPRWLVPAMLAGFSLSLALSIVFTPTSFVASYFLLPTRAWELLAGGLLAVIPIRQPGSRYWRELLALAAVLAILVPAFQYTQQTPFPGHAALLPVLGTATLIWLGGGASTAVSKLLQLRPVVYIGLISYSLYLWHWPLIVFARFQNGLQPLDEWLFALLALSIAMAALSHRFIEQPFRGGPAHHRPRVFAVAGMAMAVLVSVSVLGVKQQGFESRVSAEVLALDRQRTPEIPFQHCDGKLDGCPIGAREGLADGDRIVFWGDSHMLAWAPAIDKILKDRGISARLVMTSACPSLVGVANDMFPACERQNAWWVENLRNVDVVVMASFWARYQDENNNGFVRLGAEATGVITKGLPRTIDKLQGEGIEVLLIGPVPTYELSVPYLHANQAMLGQPVPGGKHIKDHNLQNREFYSTARGLSSRLKFIDPAEWICTPLCTVGTPPSMFYRDQHHLSISGAMFYSSRLGAVLDDQLAVDHHLPNKSQVDLGIALVNELAVGFE